MPDSPAPPPDLQAILAGLIPALRVGLPSGVEAIVILLDETTPSAAGGCSRPRLGRAAIRATLAATAELAAYRDHTPTLHPLKPVRDDD